MRPVGHGSAVLACIVVAVFFAVLINREAWGSSV